MGAIADYKKAIEEKKANKYDLTMLMFCCYVDTLLQTDGEEQMRYAEDFFNDIFDFFEELRKKGVNYE